MTPLNNDRRFTIANNILKGEEVSYHHDYTNFGEFILASMENNLDLIGEIDAVTGEVYTYRKMRERSVRCALWMRSQGLRPRDVVAVCSENHLDLPMPLFAALYLGTAYNPCHLTMDEEDLRHQIKVTKPKMIFVSEAVACLVAEIAEKAQLEMKIIVFGRVPGFLEFESVIDEPGIDDVEKFVCPPIESSAEIALVMFSSGSTGLPKGVALSHRALNMRFRQTKVLGMAGNVCLNFSLVSWMNGTAKTLWSVLLNIPRIVMPPFEEHSACAMIEKYKATWILLTPPMINRLVKFDAVDRYDLSSLTKVIYTGAALSIVSRKALARLLPKASILSFYGMTEAGGSLTLQSSNSPLGSCGQILENAQLMVVDPDTGRTLGPNRKGEILLKSASMMNFYYNNPEETAKTLDEEGWLHSGDLGYYDKSGEVFVLDRLKDIIRSADYDICPFEIESVILSHPGVKEVAVVGQQRPQDDELLMAFVVRTEDLFSDTSKQVTETDIVDLVATELKDSRKHLRAGVRFVDYIPKTMTGKIRRIVLRDMARSYGNNSSRSNETSSF